MKYTFKQILPYFERVEHIKFLSTTKKASITCLAQKGLNKGLGHRNDHGFNASFYVSMYHPTKPKSLGCVNFMELT